MRGRLPVISTLAHMELSGGWVAAEADDDVRRHGIGLDTDDAEWEQIAVPGHWRNHPKFAASDGPIMYRHAFSHSPPEEGRRRWITLDGIFYQADVWLDGAYLGDPEGYFFGHSFDITTLSKFGDDHVLAVEVTCAPQPGASGRRNITGVYQSSAAVGSGRNPGGLWRPVWLYDTGPVRIDRLRVLCRDADPRARPPADLDPARQRPSLAGHRPDDDRRRPRRRAAPFDRQRSERLRVERRHRRSETVVAAGTRRPAA